MFLPLARKGSVWKTRSAYGFQASSVQVNRTFIKILSYLLSNRKVVHITVRNVMLTPSLKIKSKMHYSFADINKAVHYPTEVILFNIDSRANVDDKEDAILKVFLKVFNERIGYCADFPHIAHLERELDKRGQYETFKAAFADINGSRWERRARRLLLHQR